MRRHAYFLLLVVILTFNANIVSNTAFAANSDFVIEDGVLVTYNGSSNNIVIPSGVTCIGMNAFQINSEVQSVILPEGVTRIDNYAFMFIDQLRKIQLPSTLDYIGDYAFYGTSLESIALPINLTYIGDCAFEGALFTTVTLPKGCVLGNYPFRGCTLLETINVTDGCRMYISDNGVLYSNSQTLLHYPSAKKGPYYVLDGTTNISSYAFYKNNGLTALYIPDNVKTIEFGGVRACYELVSIDLPTDCYTGDGCFYRCDALQSFNVRPTPNGQYLRRQSIDGVLYDYTGTAILNYPSGRGGDIIVPSGVIGIGSYAFSGNNKLTSISFPDTINYISKSAFSYCSSLRSITIPSRVMEIAEFTFEGCTLLDQVLLPHNLTAIRKGAFGICTSLSEITIPNKVTTIENNAFRDCINLTSIYIPESVTDIGFATYSLSFAFSKCVSMESIDVDINNMTYKSIDGIIYNKSGTELFACPAGKTGVITIPNDTVKIRMKAFDHCNAITSVIIPTGVTALDIDTFVYNESLRSLYIPKSVSYIDQMGINSQGGANKFSIYGEKDSYIEQWLKNPDNSPYAFIENSNGLPSPNEQAIPSSSGLILNGIALSEKFPFYTIDGEMYVRLRDLGYILSETSSQYNVIQSKEVTVDGNVYVLPRNSYLLSLNDKYYEVGGELCDFGSLTKTAFPAPSNIYINRTYTPVIGIDVRLELFKWDVYANNFKTYRIDDELYYDLYMLAYGLDILVDFDLNNNILFVNTGEVINDSANHDSTSTTEMIEITPPPNNNLKGVAGNYYYTDIVVYLWNTPVNAINIGGTALIDVESLAHYGFNVKWWPDERILTVEDQYTSSVSSKAKDGSLLDMQGGHVGNIAGQYYHTDIATYLNGLEIECYNIGGRAFINAEILTQYGYKVVWNSTQRTLVITRP